MQNTAHDGRGYRAYFDKTRNASTYIDGDPDRELYSPCGQVCQPFSWAAFTFNRLEWLYGAQRARAITSGRDPATNTDLAKWNNLIAGARP